jgi:diaminopimelate decarboxylase
VVESSGAYGYSMASTYNSRPRPVEVLVDDGRFAVITERERYDDIVAREVEAIEWRDA